jgi:hypothetical protein
MPSPHTLSFLLTHRKIRPWVMPADWQPKIDRSMELAVLHIGGYLIVDRRYHAEFLQIVSQVFSESGMLLQASADTLLEVAANPVHLGATIGFLSILHTWGQNLLLHPHVHCVVPGTSAASTTLLKMLIDPNTPPSVRIRAAEAILNHAAKAIEIEDIEARVAELERAAELAKSAGK